MLAALLALALAQPQQVPARSLALTAASSFDTTLTPGLVHEYTLRLGAGESANVVFRQMGVDVVVEAFAPDGKPLTTVDSPNGRNGDEPVELIARTTGTYLLRVRPFDGREPTGRYHVSVTALRDVRATSAMLAARARARDSAAVWLRRRSATLGDAKRPSAAFVAQFDSLARQATVIGLGEATHGSREFGDMRLLLTRRAIEQGGYRIVAIEASAARLARLNEYVAGRGSAADLRLVEAGWIGRRTLRQLVPWLRDWNRAHPNDVVSLVGLDAQDFLLDLPDLRAFLQRVYGDQVMPAWSAAERELAAADSQSSVFGDSRIDSTVRHTLVELTTRVHVDAPILRALYGDAEYDRAARTLSTVTQFADFNAGNAGVVTRSRDWYMARNLLLARSRAPGATVVYWAHNAHVAHPAGRSPENSPTGGVLRRALGCGYQAIGLTFGAGAFVAQRPNDAEDRLAVDTLPPNVDESVERVMSVASPATTLALWGCFDGTTAVPAWLQRPEQMRWVGGLWLPGSDPAQGSRPTLLLQEYDGLLYLPVVAAEEMPTDRPLIPARRAP